MPELPRLRSPVVLIHGLFGFARLSLGSWVGVDYFKLIPAALRESGNEVVQAALSPTAGVARRAEQLRDLIEALPTREPVHLVAHSMGGLDARYAIARLGLAPRVLTLTTLGTPHRGSSFADWASGRLVRLVGPVFDHFGLPREAFDDLTTESCRLFNEQTPNAPGVRYFSVAGRLKHREWLRSDWAISEPIIYRAEGANDGLVALTSASWGESCEVWDGDHISLVNWPNPFAPNEVVDRLPAYATLLGRLRDEGY
jgi:triacylglycerol lipase